MSEEETRAVSDRFVGKRITRIELYAVLGAVMPAELKTVSLLVDQGDPEMFLSRIRLGEAARKETPGCLDPIQPNG